MSDKTTLVTVIDCNPGQGDNIQNLEGLAGANMAGADGCHSWVGYRNRNNPDQFINISVWDKEGQARTFIQKSRESGATTLWEEYLVTDPTFYFLDEVESATAEE